MQVFELDRCPWVHVLTCDGPYKLNLLLSCLCDLVRAVMFLDFAIATSTCATMVVVVIVVSRGLQMKVHLRMLCVARDCIANLGGSEFTTLQFLSHEQVEACWLF